MDCLGLILEIVSKYLGYSRDYEKPSIEKLESLKTDLGSADPTGPLAELAKLLNSKTHTSDVWAFLESAASGLSDPFPTSSSGVSFVMCLVLKVRPAQSHFVQYKLCLYGFKHLGSWRRNSFTNKRTTGHTAGSFKKR